VIDCVFAGRAAVANMKVLSTQGGAVIGNVGGNAPVVIDIGINE
jgi:hypothetical protein